MAEIELDESALALAHLAVEDTLIRFRDRRIGVLGKANGFVVNERNGEPSPVMRLGTRDGLRIGIKAYLAAMATGDPAAEMERIRREHPIYGDNTEETK
jgi:hypothetical protein